MKTYCTNWLMLLVCCLVTLNLKALPLAEGDERAKAMKWLTALQKKYAAENLKFDVYMSYTNEHTPDVLLDSTSGVLMLSGSNYYFSIQHTVTIKNDRYCVLVFNEDKLLGIGKAAQAASPISQLQQMDSLMQYPGVTVKTTEAKNTNVIELLLPPGSEQKSLRININRQSGCLERIVYLIKTDNLVDPWLRKEQGKDAYEPYARVETRFTQQPGGIDKAVFDEASYFIKKGDKLEPAAQYKDFKIFQVTPTL
ncbi:hypothetical protein [Deminuibacter soli]|uniref:DUF4292 domain-containing protein n=1 Tax=Deminuibacter soli TaxID=2291815 RepID=A0A3E1NGP1_9BACT|nr:hypothetical protein [Deminuibacter soli]RFM26958.1 hypothetical protein DXN05_18410 [Deminuibacter soli]